MDNTCGMAGRVSGYGFLIGDDSSKKVSCVSFTDSCCHPDLPKHHGCRRCQGASVLRRAGCADLYRKLGDNSAPRLRGGHVPLKYEPQLTGTATHSDAILEPNTGKEPLADHHRLTCHGLSRSETRGSIVDFPDGSFTEDTDSVCY